MDFVPNGRDSFEYLKILLATKLNAIILLGPNVGGHYCGRDRESPYPKLTEVSVIVFVPIYLSEWLAS